MRRFNNIAAVVLLLVLLILPKAQHYVRATRKESLQHHGDVKHVVEVFAGLLTPGLRPQGIGEPLTMFRVVADEYEALHPDTRIAFRKQPAIGGAVEGEWVRTQLAGGVAPEIVAINTESVWPDADKGWWLSLEPYMAEPNPYVPGDETWIETFANQALTQAKRGPDGYLYCVSFDLVETAIFYNKDIFEEVGVAIPETWAEFVEMQKKLKTAGYIPLCMADANAADWAQDIVFDQLYYPILDEIDVERGPDEEEEYLRGYLFPKELCYNIKRGYFSPQDERYREMWRLIKEWRAYWNLDLVNTDRVRLFVIGKAAMMWEGSWFIRRMLNDPYVDFEWGVFYLPPMTEETSPFAAGVEAAVIGGAGLQLSVTKRAIDDGDLDQTIDFLRFITAPRNCERIVEEAGMFIPNIRGARMAPHLEPFAEIIKRRYCTVKWTFSFEPEFNDYMRRTLALYLGGGISLDDFMKLHYEHLQKTADYFIAKEGWDFAEFDRAADQ
jgi:raffinose/stachyose/melibiose transport system substrate-binding protein